MAKDVLARYDRRTQANIATLRPDYAEKVVRWYDACRGAGLHPLVHFGARTAPQQQILYERYLAHKGPKAVAPKKSYHCYGRAIDWVNIIGADGRDSDLDWNSVRSYELGISLAEPLGIRGIGASDLDHLQDARFETWRDLPAADFIRA